MPRNLQKAEFLAVAISGPSQLAGQGARTVRKRGEFTTRIKIFETAPCPNRRCRDGNSLQHSTVDTRHNRERCGTEALIGSRCVLGMIRLMLAPFGDKGSYPGRPSSAHPCHHP